MNIYLPPENPREMEQNTRHKALSLSRCGGILVQYSTRQLLEHLAACENFIKGGGVFKLFGVSKKMLESG